MIKRLEALLGVRAATCWLLIIGTILLYFYGMKDAANNFLVLTTTAVTWMFKSRSDRETK